MEDLARDPDIGPDLINLLTQKVKTTREALNVALKENVDLREEMAKIGEGRIVYAEKGIAGDGSMDVICQAEQCKSRGTIECLQKQLAETVEKLKTTEQALTESLGEVTRLKDKYERTDNTSGSEGEVSQLRDANEQPNSEVPEEPVLPAPSNGSEESVIAALATEDPTTDERMSQPCLPPRMAPCQVPKDLHNLMCKGGSLFWPERSLVDPIKGSAITFACEKRYVRSASGEEHTWIPSTYLFGLQGKLREIFHKQDGEIMYAGTFQASPATRECRAEQYQALPDDLRQHLLTSSFASAQPGKAKASEEEKALVTGKYSSGEAKMMYLRWDRVSFNTELFNALVSLRAASTYTNKESGQHTLPVGGNKRKIQGDEASSQKKSKLDKAAVMSLLI